MDCQSGFNCRKFCPRIASASIARLWQSQTMVKWLQAHYLLTSIGCNSFHYAIHYGSLPAAEPFSFRPRLICNPSHPGFGDPLNRFQRGCLFAIEVALVLARRKLQPGSSGRTDTLCEKLAAPQLASTWCSRHQPIAHNARVSHTPDDIRHISPECRLGVPAATPPQRRLYLSAHTERRAFRRL